MNIKVMRGQFYFADLSPIVGSEQAGVRPVLVLQNDRYNAKSPTTIVAAVTGRHKKLMQRTHVLLSADSALPGSVILLEQIRIAFAVQLYVKDGCIAGGRITKYKETCCECGLRPSGYEMAPTQQELRIAKRILEYLIEDGE